MNSSLKNGSGREKLALITGASSGFGKLTSGLLLKNGFRVIAVVRGGEERGRKIYSDFEHEISNKVLQFIDIDLAQPDSINKALPNLNQLVPHRLDVFIHCAGMSYLGPTECATHNQLLELFQVNCFSAHTLITALVPKLVEGKGRVINVSSMASFVVFPYYGLYSSSKAALQKMTEGFHLELSPFGIQCCSVEPGGYLTGFNKRSRLLEFNSEQAERYKQRQGRFPQFLEKVDGFSNKNPEEVAGLIFKLCYDYGRFAV